MALRQPPSPSMSGRAPWALAAARTGVFACNINDGKVYKAQAEIWGRVFWPSGKASSYVHTWTYDNPDGWFTYYCPP
jgi:hypothetical protein